MRQGTHACVDGRSRDLVDLRLDAGQVDPPRLLAAWLRALLDLASPSAADSTKIRVSRVTDEWLLVHASDEEKRGGGV